MNIVKRDGKIVCFDRFKIYDVFRKAFNSVGESTDEAQVASMKFIDEKLDSFLNSDLDVSVEKMQTLIEDFLMQNGYNNVARAYIEYRSKKDRDRYKVKEQIEFIENYMKSDNNANATVDDNSNVATHNVATCAAESQKADNIIKNRGMIVEELRKNFSDKIDPKQYIRDLESHEIYKNDESTMPGVLVPYCASISQYPMLINGIKGMGGLSAVPQNLDSYCGIYCNEVHSVSGQFAGAVATSEFLLYFDYFARKRWGNLYYKNYDMPDGQFFKYTEESEKTGKIKPNLISIRKKIYQKFEQVIYNINQPVGARNSQASFVNFSYFDKPYFEAMFGEFVFPDGTRPIWESLSALQKLFMEWFNNERLRCVLTFPVESFALIWDKDKQEFADKESADFVAKEYSEGHSFFTYISDSADSLSSCCRLRNQVKTKEFSFTNGNIGIMTGSKSVITLNLNRITQNYIRYRKENNINDWDIWKGLNGYINQILERVYIYHESYNNILKRYEKAGMLSAYNSGFISLDKQYLTIGLNGLNEAAEFLGIEISDNEKYSHFCQQLFSNIKEQNEKHNTKTLSFNTECVPAESLGAKNYKWDKEDGYWVPLNHNVYTSYIFRPSDKNLNIIDKIKMHGSRYIGEYLDGGSACHINLEEHLTYAQYKQVMKIAAKEGCQYFTFNIPYSECEECGNIVHKPINECVKCGSNKMFSYDRVIGYLTKIKNWSLPRQIEGATRVYEKVGNTI